METVERTINQSSFIREAQPFLEFLPVWLQSLPRLSLEKAYPVPANAGIISVDVTVGFCQSGALASPRVGAIVAPIARLMRRSWDYGVRDIVLPQDTHEPDAVEFDTWPVHCVRGTPEAETVAEIKALPFFDQITVLEKNSIDSGANTGLDDWMRARPHLDTFVVVGDCTDMCVYQLAMHLRTQADARQLKRRVIVPVDCVDTYDYPVEAAARSGGLPHPADLLHHIFLYHMALNGVEVVRAIGD